MYYNDSMTKNYQKFLAEQQLKNTAQRSELFEMVMKERSHFSVDDLHKKIKGKIGIATLYRFLRLLVSSQMLNEYNFGEQTLFERKDSQHHDHIICTKCNTIDEFFSPEIENLQEKIVEKKGFKLTSHRHELYGICKKCQ